jgi:hypothetical protein
VVPSPIVGPFFVCAPGFFSFLFSVSDRIHGKKNLCSAQSSRLDIAPPKNPHLLRWVISGTNIPAAANRALISLESLLLTP